MSVAPWNRALVSHIGNYYNHDSDGTGKPNTYIRHGTVYDNDPHKATYSKVDGSGVSHPHQAVDVCAPIGTPLYAPWDGEVVLDGYNDTRGEYVTIQCKNGLYVHVAHIDVQHAIQGDKVTSGQQVATISNSGVAGAPHVHLQVMGGVWGPAIDPLLDHRTRHWFDGIPFKPVSEGAVVRQFGNVTARINGASEFTAPRDVVLPYNISVDDDEIVEVWNVAKHVKGRFSDRADWQKIPSFNILEHIDGVFVSGRLCRFEYMQQAAPGLYLFQVETRKGLTNPIRVRVVDESVM